VKRFALLVVGVVIVVCGVAVVRTLRVPAPPPARDAAGPRVRLDSATAVAHLAGAVRFKTVSYASGGPIDTAAFRGLHEFLAKAFPRVTATLSRETVNGLSLLYTWRGQDTTLAPVVLMGHMDVVPVPEANLREWTHDPFSGDVADGYVWGRGTLDDKTTVLAVLEAAEALIASGYRPPRTVYFTFGHDEEVGGLYGARKIVDLLVSRGVKPALVLDEGGFMATGAVPGVPGQVAIVGIAEKGYVTLRLKAMARGGHSSMPPGRTAVGAVSRAVAALEANPFPFVLDGPTQGMLEAAAPYLPFASRMAVANLWLTRPLLVKAMRQTPMGAALLHTTTAPTMLAAGVKDNVLSPEATAIVNFRIRPGETVASVKERVRRVIADSLITVEQIDSAAVDPSPVSDIHSAAFAAIGDAIRSLTPGTATPVIPYLVFGGTDAKYWGAHSDRVFRFLPIPLGEGDEARVHGVNERVSVGGYTTSVNFFATLLRGLDKL
jgi:carboxypeptidase PM20D1